MTPALCRWIFLGCCALVWRWNRRLLATGAPFRLPVELLWFSGLVILPAVLWCFFPLPRISALSWILTFLVLLRLGWRLTSQLINFAAVRSRSSDLPGARGRFLTTRALQLRTYSFEDAPARLSGLRAVFISDLHCDGWPEPAWYDRLWQNIRQLQPDLLLLGGDNLTHPESLPVLNRCLRDLPGVRPALGTFAVLGNHDATAAGAVRRSLANHGARLLEDETIVLERPDGNVLRLAGTSWPWCESVSLRQCLAEGPADIVLTHTPDNAPELANAGASWILAGHTHGGQAALPVIGGFLSPSRHGARWICGHYPMKRSHLIVSAGVGCTGLPLRLLVHPEIVLLRF